MQYNTLVHKICAATLSICLIVPSIVHTQSSVVEDIGKQVAVSAASCVTQELLSQGLNLASGVFDDVFGGISDEIAGAANFLGGSVPVRDANTKRAINKNTAEGVRGNLKECIYDRAVIVLKEEIIRSIINELIRGLTGENGSFYVKNEKKFLELLEDEVIDSFLSNEDNFSALCNLWEADVRAALAIKYFSDLANEYTNYLLASEAGVRQQRKSARAQCTLEADGETFTSGDYWDDFLNRTTTVGGNAVTAYLDAEERLQEDIQRVLDGKTTELDRNNGFLNVTVCGDLSGDYEVIGLSKSREGQKRALGEDCDVATPGTLVESQLNSALDSDLRRLELADELDELFVTLQRTLFQRIFNKNSTGGFSNSGVVQGEVDGYRSELAEDPNSIEAENNNYLNLKGLLDRYGDNLSDSKKAQKQIVSETNAVERIIRDAGMCYQDSKYDRLLDSDGEVIPTEDALEDIESGRNRSTYSYSTTNLFNEEVTHTLEPVEVIVHADSTTKEIKDFAEENNIDLQGADTKTEMLAQIKESIQDYHFTYIIKSPRPAESFTGKITAQGERDLLSQTTVLANSTTKERDQDLVDGLLEQAGKTKTNSADVYLNSITTSLGEQELFVDGNITRPLSLEERFAIESEWYQILLEQSRKLKFATDEDIDGYITDIIKIQKLKINDKKDNNKPLNSLEQAIDTDQGSRSTEEKNLVDNFIESEKILIKTEKRDIVESQVPIIKLALSKLISLSHNQENIREQLIASNTKLRSVEDSSNYYTKNFCNQFNADNAADYRDN